ncbi:hypothetical protein ACFW16_24815 [Inquilinus sp. NPDC058860]|uniref:hypothetical protein n=1 Tax=Inquilinus sp. NPDC058860 TaxID=3346652 RepID=UPI00369B3D8E
MIRFTGLYVPPGHYGDLGTYYRFECDSEGGVTTILAHEDDLEDGCELPSHLDARAAGALAIQSCGARLEAAFRDAITEGSRYCDGQVLVRLRHLDPSQVV